MENSKLELISAKNSILLLVDYQPSMLRGVQSGDRTSIMNAALAASKAAQILEVPVVYTSIYPEGNGAFLKSLTDLFPGQEVISRTVHSFDAFEEVKVLNAVKNSKKKKLIVAGLWTSMCFAFTALRGIREDLDVYGLIDAGGDASVEAHKYGVKRMLQAGVAPITWMSLTAEWMHDWGNPKAGQLETEVYGRFDTMWDV
jgi:nicotinamidase-related amidase